MPTKPLTPAIISVTEFKARCLELVTQVDRTGQEIVVTKRNRPIARLVPMQPATAAYPLFGRSKGQLRVIGDIVAPINADWDVDEDY